MLKREGDKGLSHSQNSQRSVYFQMILNCLKWIVVDHVIMSGILLCKLPVSKALHMGAYLCTDLMHWMSRDASLEENDGAHV